MAVKAPKIDWHKAILGSLILVFGALVMVTTMIVPFVREVRKQTVFLTVEKTSHLKAKARYDEEIARLNEFKSENNKSIRAFHNKFEPQTFTKSFGELAMLEFVKTSSGEEKDYSYVDYNVTVGFGSPKQFFDLLAAIDSAPYISTFGFPIVIASNNQTIYAGFSIRTFMLANIKEKRKPHVEEGQVSEVAAHTENNATQHAPEHAAEHTEHKPAASH